MYLKHLFRLGSGIDNIDLNYIKKKKIKFSKSKITPEIAVAELIVGYTLSIYRLKSLGGLKGGEGDESKEDGKVEE